MDTLGYSCKSFPNSGYASAFMECTTNDGRMFRIETTPGQGGIENPSSFGATTLQFQEMNQSNPDGTSAVCPDACYYGYSGTASPVETFGGMDLNGDSACSGFMSAHSYCGGYCYNQPAIESGAAQKPISPPVDCRGCPPVQTYSACPDGYLPYQGDDEPGGYCCAISGIEFIGEDLPYPVAVFPYSSSEYGAFTIDHCSDYSTAGYVACPSPPCGVNGTRIPSAASSACFPWGNTSMDVIFPFTY